MVVRFAIPGKPMGKQRPKFSNAGRFVKTYTPKETINYESKVVYFYKESVNQYLGLSPIKATLICSFGLNKGDYGKKGLNKSGREKLEGIKRPTIKSDADNIAKIVLDALNGIAYNDDSQVVELVVIKKYAEIEQVEVELETL